MFQVDQVQADPKTSFTYLLQETPLAEKDSAFSWELVSGCIQNLADIDAAIARHSKDWRLERMSAVDRSLMRIAAYEILFSENPQPVVAIDEAVEISKRYGEDNSSSFINAILDKIRGEKA